jgi:hypothetical protein
MTEKHTKQICLIQRAIGIIEGVAMMSEMRVGEALGTAVEMIDMAVEEIRNGGKDGV